jgi:arsenate reductase-like glutaredoxin family protein
MKEELIMTTTVTFVVLLLSIAAIPGSSLAKETMDGDVQPPEVNIMPGANQLPTTILAVSPIMPRGPKDLIEGYEGEMQVVSGRFANELASISHAADENQMSGQQAEEISKERFQVAMMQFQLLVALRANLEREIDRAEQTAQRESRPTQENVSAVVELPFSSLQLNPKLIRYLQLNPSQASAIQDVMSRERQNIDPMMADLRTTGEKLFRANQQGYTDSKEVRILAASQATILSRLIVANSRMQAKIYALLNGEQRKKLEHLRQADEVAVLDEQ